MTEEEEKWEEEFQEFKHEFIAQHRDNFYQQIFSLAEDIILKAWMESRRRGKEGE